MKLGMLSVGCLATSLLSHAALAQGYDELGAYKASREHESSQSAAVEVRFGPYRPNVDDGLGGTPFDDIFGKTRYALGVEYDWQLLRIPNIGTLGPGVGMSYVRYTAKAPLASGDGRSGQDTRLWIMPLWGAGVFRVDVLARNFKVPLVPYGKLGLVYAFWNCSTGDGRCRSADGTLGRGTETGYMYAAGLMLLLDWRDPASAKEMDTSVGVNNSYFFGELYGSDVDSFGNGMQVGTNTWTLGLAFEF